MTAYARRQVPCIVPDPRRLRIRDAADIAAEVVDEIARLNCLQLAIFILPQGEVRMMPARGKSFSGKMLNYSDSLVGVYDCDASRSDIEADILEMERVH
jgi:hypothetical protein